MIQWTVLSLVRILAGHCSTPSHLSESMLVQLNKIRTKVLFQENILKIASSQYRPFYPDLSVLKTRYWWLFCPEFYGLCMERSSRWKVKYLSICEHMYIYTYTLVAVLQWCNMSVMVSQLTGNATLCYLTACSRWTTKKCQYSHYWPLWSESIGGFPLQMTSDAENHFMWWRHNVLLLKLNSLQLKLWFRCYLVLALLFGRDVFTFDIYTTTKPNHNAVFCSTTLRNHQ